MSFLDSLFGADDSATKAQAKANARAQEFVEEQTALARGDAQRLYQQSMLPLEQGYQSSIDALGGTLRQQIDTTARGNYFGQEQIANGAQQFQNAILGIPVDYSTMQPKILHPERNLEWMFNQRLGTRSGGHNPGEGADTAALQELHNAGLSNQQIRDLYSDNLAKTATPGVSFTPGEATNQQLVAQLYNAGLLSGTDNSRLQTSFRNDPALGPATNWGSAGSSANLLNRDWSQTSPEYTSTLQNLFNAIYGGK